MKGRKKQVYSWRGESMYERRQNYSYIVVFDNPSFLGSTDYWSFNIMTSSIKKSHYFYGIEKIQTKCDRFLNLKPELSSKL